MKACLDQLSLEVVVLGLHLLDGCVRSLVHLLLLADCPFELQLRRLKSLRSKAVLRGHHPPFRLLHLGRRAHRGCDPLLHLRLSPRRLRLYLRSVCLELRGILLALCRLLSCRKPSVICCLLDALEIWR